MTAVEFIEQQYNYNSKLTAVDFYQAKEMEKQQIIDAYVNGDIDAGIYAATKKNAEQYYNETFNK
jgi:hypothetical protein